MPIPHHRSSSLPILVIAAIYIVAMIACGRVDYNARQTMAVADSLMESDPDSSLTLLKSINTHEVDTRWDDANRALYGLLLTQAAVKSDSSHLLDSARIAFAVQWFDSHGSKFNRLRSLFYLSYVEMLTEQYQPSMTHAMHALEEAEKFSDDYWLAKCNEQLAILMSQGYQRHKVIPYTKKAVYYYKKCGRDANYRWLLSDLAMDYSNNNELDSAELIWSDVIKMDLTQAYDTLHAAMCLSDLMCMYAKQGRYVDAHRCLTEFEKYVDYFRPGASHFAYEARIRMNDLSENEFMGLLNKSRNSWQRKSDKSCYYKVLRDFYVYKDSLTKAIMCYDSMMMNQNEVIKDIMQQSVVAGEKEYLQNQLEINKIEHDKSILKNWITGLCTFIILFIVVSILWYKVREKNVEIDRRISEIMELSEQLTEKSFDTQMISDSLFKSEERFVELQTVLRRYFYDSWNVLNSLCAEYYEKGSSARTRSLIVKDLEAQIDRMTTREMRDEIERRINECCSNIVARLREQCPNLSESDINFITLIYSGFSPKAVAVLSGMNLKYFYTRRSRLAKRILQTSAMDKTEFVEKLSIKESKK